MLEYYQAFDELWRKYFKLKPAWVPAIKGSNTAVLFFSIVEFTQQGGASGLSVLRTFRLLRILKLVRFMPALRRQLVVMLRTMDNVATFFALLVLFIFIFRWVVINLLKLVDLFS
jgi:hypothetical protein